MATTPPRVSLQKSFVPIGTWRGPNGDPINVTVTEEWRRTLEQLFATVNALANAPPRVGLTIESAPPYQFGNIVFTASEYSFQRLPNGAEGFALFSGGMNAQPYWAEFPSPDPGTTVTPRQITAYGALRAY